MEIRTMQAEYSCIRSRPLDASRLHDLAGNWHKRGESSIRDALVEPDQETVLTTSFCVRPDEVHCLTTVGIFTPSGYLNHTAQGELTGAEAFHHASKFFAWVHEHESTGELDRWAAIFYMAESQEALDNFDNKAFHLEWKKARRANGSGRALRLRIGQNSPLTREKEERARFFEKCLQTLSLQEFIAIEIQKERLVFTAKIPWGVFPHGDEYPKGDPMIMDIFPFEDVESLAEGASKLLGATQHKVFRIVLMVESLLGVHNRICHTLPVEYKGWQMNCFGAPSEALQAWFAGDLNARPPGRIPIGRGWEGDPYLGFPYSVSVVETPDGPCIELGSDNATHEQLKASLVTATSR